MRTRTILTIVIIVVIVLVIFGIIFGLSWNGFLVGSGRSIQCLTSINTQPGPNDHHIDLSVSMDPLATPKTFLMGLEFPGHSDLTSSNLFRCYSRIDMSQFQYTDDGDVRTFHGKIVIPRSSSQSSQSWTIRSAIINVYDTGSDVNPNFTVGSTVYNAPLGLWKYIPTSSSLGQKMTDITSNNNGIELKITMQLGDVDPHRPYRNMYAVHLSDASIAPPRDITFPGSCNSTQESGGCGTLLDPNGPTTCDCPDNWCIRSSDVRNDTGVGFYDVTCADGRSTTFQQQQASCFGFGAMVFKDVNSSENYCVPNTAFTGITQAQGDESIGVNYCKCSG